MRKVLFLLLFSPLLALPHVANASHIVGAELNYRCLGNNNYRFTLTMYRDCLNGTADFDDPITLFVFETNSGAQVNMWDVNLDPNTPEVQPENWDACVGTPYNICVEVGTYEVTLFLPPIPGGYNVAWARCCRNYAITNLAAPDCEGVTFLAHVPGSDQVSTCNSMPTFNNYPPTFLCAGMTLNFDHSATDLDGDSLVYEISNPYTSYNFQSIGAGAGAGGGCPVTLGPQVNVANPMGPAPYQNVTFAPGHSYTNPFGTGSISINPTTGFLTATPLTNGIYVLAISVKEYRNGILLSENKRDFQFHVITCLTQDPPPLLSHDLSGLNSSGDTVFVPAAMPFCYEFTVDDTVAPSFITVTPVSVSFGGNGGFPAPYATLSTNGNVPPVTGTVCWKPHCFYVGQTVPMIIAVRDTNDCANYNIIFDTVYVHILPSPSIAPMVTHDLSGLNTNGDTILVDVQSPFCYEFAVIDTAGGGDITFENTLYEDIGVPANQVQTVTTWTNGDTLFGRVCWNGYCNFDRVYHFVTKGVDLNRCPPGNTSYDTVWIRIIAPQNPAPTLTTDLLANPMNNDTIIARVHENFCFDFDIVDTSSSPAWDSLAFSYLIEHHPSGAPTSASPSYFVTMNGDSLHGQICWTPRCPQVDNTFRIIIRATQYNLCYINASVYDTVYVHVIEPLKPPPAIGHQIGSQSPDNQNIFISDNETFCYDFELHDTLMPTYLTYDIRVEYLNGVPFTGSLPSLTYTNQLDSFVTGTICWEVPCELAGESFRIIAEGRDTFDCHPGNTVWDTVNIFHTENPPAKVNLCRITVLPGDASTELSWHQAGDPDPDHYRIYRRRDDEISFTLLDSTTSFSDTTWTDNTGLLADEFVYCYYVTTIDRCGLESATFDQSCTILLEGESEGYEAHLNWTPYIGWPAGVSSYDIEHRDGTLPGSPFANTANAANNVLEFDHRDIQYAITCYRVTANEQNPGCGVTSSSNEICLVFPSTLFLPNAFTPNGDGTNDFFVVPGEFLQYFHIAVYNRWGALIFESYDPNAGWDGKYKGNDVPEGSYVYRVEATGYDGQQHVSHSSVTVLR